MSGYEMLHYTRQFNHVDFENQSFAIYLLSKLWKDLLSLNKIDSKCDCRNEEMFHCKTRNV